jgi:hypothetical protein
MLKLKNILKNLKKVNKKESTPRKREGMVDQGMHEQVRAILQNNYQTIIKTA